MTFFVCVSLPVFGGKTSTDSAPEQNSETQKVYAHDALTNAFIQCVENKMPMRKAAKLYNIPHTRYLDLPETLKLSERLPKYMKDQRIMEILMDTSANCKNVY